MLKVFILKIFTVEGAHTTDDGKRKNEKEGTNQQAIVCVKIIFETLKKFIHEEQVYLPIKERKKSEIKLQEWFFTDIKKALYAHLIMKAHNSAHFNMLNNYSKIHLMFLFLILRCSLTIEAESRINPMQFAICDF
jgi:hypothetical protein